MTDTPTPGRLLRRHEVEQLVGLGRSALYDHMQKGDFPRPLRVGKSAVRWPESVVLAWIATRTNDYGNTAAEILAQIGREAAR